MKIVEVATAEIGQTEKPSNSNKTKYGKWFGFDGVAWCGIFVSWVYHQSGFPLGNIGFLKGFAGCQTAVAHFKKQGEITKTPKTGDIVFFDWNNDGRYDHTGIFVRQIDENTFETIEGNTSLKNDSNGGSVMKRVRNYQKNGGSVNVVFVHPKILDSTKLESPIIQSDVQNSTNEAKKCEDISHFHLGQKVTTNDGKGIIVKLEMEWNGLVVSPEKCTAVVWFLNSIGSKNRYITKSYKLSELSDF